MNIYVLFASAAKSEKTFGTAMGTIYAFKRFAFTVHVDILEDLGAALQRLDAISYCARVTDSLRTCRAIASAVGR